MFTLAMPQSLPAGRQEALGVLQAVGEDRRRQAVLRRRYASRSPRRASRTRSGTGSARTSRCCTISQSPRARTIVGSTKLPGPPSTLSPHSTVPPAAAPPRSPRCSARPRARRSAAPSACPIPADCRSAPAHRRAVSRCSSSCERDSVHEHAARARAALAGSADRAEHDRRHREIEVRELVDDDRVVAAELEQALAETLGDALADFAADGRRTGERHQVDAPIVDELLGELGARADEQLEDARADLVARARGSRCAAPRSRTAAPSATASTRTHRRRPPRGTHSTTTPRPGS